MYAVTARSETYTTTCDRRPPQRHLPPLLIPTNLVLGLDPERDLGPERGREH
ncbi:hypothetical protein ACFYNY_32655 [Streptomyces sp. NPDC006530]|uniref:hypothetical protein n=1 Tax=Streptomyces sp. NPDC006530 TaxID=3364750 RepID=UPI0036AA9DE0